MVSTTRNAKWLRPGFPAGAILFVLLAIFAVGGVPAAHAQENLVHIDPSGAAVAPGGTFSVAVVDEPTEASTSAWVLELAYDPTVVTTKGEDCRSLSAPGGSVGAFACETADTDDDGVDDTVKILGAVLFRRSGKGLIDETTLADITFTAVGDPGSCTDLKLRILIHSDSEGHETGASVQDGHACIAGDAPASGTASPFPVTPRTSQPTPIGTGNVALTPGNDTEQPTEPGQTAASGGSVSGSGSGAPRTTSPGGGGTVTEKDDGGTSAWVWALGGAAVLVLAAGSAWGVVRARGGRKGEPGPGPEA